MFRFLALFALVFSGPLSAELVTEWQVEATTERLPAYPNHPISSHTLTFVLSDDRGDVTLEDFDYIGWSRFTEANSGFRNFTASGPDVYGIYGAPGGTGILPGETDFALYFRYSDGSLTPTNFVYTVGSINAYGVASRPPTATLINKFGYTGAERDGFLEDAREAQLKRNTVAIVPYLTTFSGATANTIKAIFDGVITNIGSALTLNENTIGTILSVAVTLLASTLVAYYIGIGAGLAAASSALAVGSALLFADAYYFAEETIALRKANDPPDYAYDQIFTFSDVDSLPDLGVLPEDQSLIQNMFAEVVGGIEAEQGELVSMERGQAALLDGDRIAIDAQKAALNYFLEEQPDRRESALATVNNVLEQQPGAVPEPSAWLMMLIGLFSVGAMLRSSASRSRNQLA